MERWNIGFEWKKNTLQDFKQPIIPAFQHSIIPCGLAVE
jgi:hypothetical protein